MSFTMGDSWTLNRVATHSSKERPTPSQPVTDTRLEPFRGILTALALSVPIWVCIIGLVYALT